jgi:hypothetical protein
MKKFIPLLILLASLSSQVFADTAPEGKSIIYCPHHVECMKGRDAESCVVSDNKYGFWGKPRPIGEKKRNIVRGMYYLEQVGGMYGVSSCTYKSILSPHIVSHLLLERRIFDVGDLDFAYVYMEPELSDINTGWWVIDDIAECKSNDTKLCPMVEEPEIAFDYNSVQEAKVSKIEINGIEGTNTSRYSYDELLLNCGATSLCYMDLKQYTPPNQYETVGSVRIDVSLPDKVDIVSISSAEGSPCEFKKKEPFNLIYCEPKEKK